MLCGSVAEPLLTCQASGIPTLCCCRSLQEADAAHRNALSLSVAQRCSLQVLLQIFPVYGKRDRHRCKHLPVLNVLGQSVVF